ncbi:unnamed protein product, partial [marine sediment metagenome]
MLKKTIFAMAIIGISATFNSNSMIQNKDDQEDKSQVLLDEDIENNNVPKIKRLLAAGKIKVTKYVFATIVRRDNRNIVHLFLNHINQTIKDKGDKRKILGRGLQTSVRKGYFDIVELLVKNGADI